MNYAVQPISNSPTAEDPLSEQRLYDDDDDYLGEVVLAIDVKNNNTVGASFYVAREEKLYVSNDMKYGGLEVVEARKCSNV